MLGMYTHGQIDASSTPQRMPAPAARAAGIARGAARAVAVSLTALLAGCGSIAPSVPLHSLNAHETFASASTFSRLFDSTPERTCEAARRALLSQGYLINIAKGKEVEGQKSFQPGPDNHQLITIRVVCAADGTDGRVSLGFVSALKDTYNLKKSSNSASVGVGALGSLSLPFSAGNDSLIKVASETLSSATFYDSFFDLIKTFLRQDEPRGEPAAEQSHREG